MLWRGVERDECHIQPAQAQCSALRGVTHSQQTGAGTYNDRTLAGKCVEDKEQMNEWTSSFFPSLLLSFIYSLTLSLHFQDPLTECPHQPSPRHTKRRDVQSMPSRSSQPSAGSRSGKKAVRSRGKVSLKGTNPGNRTARSGWLGTRAGGQSGKAPQRR